MSSNVYGPFNEKMFKEILSGKRALVKRYVIKETSTLVNLIVRSFVLLATTATTSLNKGWQDLKTDLKDPFLL